jgi:hypothetical protein
MTTGLKVVDTRRKAVPSFFQAPILRCLDFLLLQAAMEPLDIAVALRVMIGRTPMRDPETPQCL